VDDGLADSCRNIRSDNPQMVVAGDNILTSRSPRARRGGIVARWADGMADCRPGEVRMNGEGEVYSNDLGSEMEDDGIRMGLLCRRHWMVEHILFEVDRHGTHDAYRVLVAEDETLVYHRNYMSWKASVSVDIGGGPRLGIYSVAEAVAVVHAFYLNGGRSQEDAAEVDMKDGRAGTA